MFTVRGALYSVSRRPFLVIGDRWGHLLRSTQLRSGCVLAFDCP